MFLLIPDTYPIHTRHIPDTYVYPMNTPRISRVYSMNTPSKKSLWEPRNCKPISSPAASSVLAATPRVIPCSYWLFCARRWSAVYLPFSSVRFSRAPRVDGLLNAPVFSPFYLLFYVHYPECYSGTRVYAILCQSPDFALKNPIYFLKIVAKIIRKVIFCQNETLICEYRTSFS